MLTLGIAKSYRCGVERLRGHRSVDTIALAPEGSDREGSAAVFQTRAEDFVAHRELQEEVFGGASLVVQCEDETESKASCFMSRVSLRWPCITTTMITKA